MKKIINLTPHDIHVFDANNNLIETFPKSNEPLRIEFESRIVDTVNGYGIYESEYGEFNYLPPFDDDTVYIVAMLCAQAAKRKDFLIVQDTVRDEEGRIIACRAFGRIV